VLADGEGVSFGNKCVKEAMGEIFEHAVKLGGTITGEHGVGVAKRPFLSREQAAPVIDLQKRVKQAFDPENLLNPGKIFPA
jgi:glycolate oxidase